MILVNDLTICQGVFRLEDIFLEVPTGKYGVLMGKTGCGKTSILEAVAGLRPSATGKVWLGNRNVTTLPPGERGLGYVPQDAALFRTMSVYNHLAFALSLRNWNRSAIDRRVRELAGWLGIGHLLKRRPVGLSGGEAQRVSLGRALSFQPKYLLLDEPLSSVDEEMRGSLIHLLNRIHESHELTVLHVTHNEVEADRLADVRFRLVEGKVEREG
jgi:ABC-type sugar transport system ATPase subunit